jgi:parvulin-like peptidyl-prolyl isomerase
LQGEQPTDKDALDYYRRHPEDFAQACVSHILVKTRPAAADLVDQLTKGGDFGALARARSQDPGSGQQGGSLGCGPLAQYVNAFKVAAYRQPLNEVSSPVRSQFGWHVILVTSRQLPAFDVVKSDVLSLLQRQAGQRLDEVITAGLRKGRVKVDPRYGTFQLSSQGAQVIPPAPPTVPDSPHPSRPSGPTPFPPGPPQG